jgi:hypothetical protein
MVRILPNPLTFYQIFALLVPWDYPGLSNKTATTSPFTIVFKQFGSSASPKTSYIAPNIPSPQPPLHPFMNAVVLSSVDFCWQSCAFCWHTGALRACRKPPMRHPCSRGRRAEASRFPRCLLTSSFSAAVFWQLVHRAAVSYGHGYRISLAYLTRYGGRFFCQAVPCRLLSINVLMHVPWPCVACRSRGYRSGSRRGASGPRGRRKAARSRR